MAHFFRLLSPPSEEIHQIWATFPSLLRHSRASEHVFRLFYFSIFHMVQLTFPGIQGRFAQTIENFGCFSCRSKMLIVLCLIQQIQISPQLLNMFPGFWFTYAGLPNRFLYYEHVSLASVLIPDLMKMFFEHLNVFPVLSWFFGVHIVYSWLRNFFLNFKSTFSGIRSLSLWIAIHGLRRTFSVLKTTFWDQVSQASIVF